MAFPIRKNSSLWNDPRMSALNALIKKELGIKKAQAMDALTPEQKQQIGSLITNLKNTVYGFIAELQKMIASAGGAPSISVDYLGSFDDMFDIAKEVEEYRDWAPQFGLDPENLDIALDTLESAAMSGEIANSNSRRPNLEIMNDQQVIDALTALMEVSLPEEDYPLTDLDQAPTSLGAQRGVIDILINGTDGEREALLQKYGLTKEKFMEILVENGYLKTSRADLATERHLVQGYKNFIEGAVRQAGGDRVQIDDEGFDSSELVSLIRKSKRDTLSSRPKGDHGVVLQDLSGTDFFLRYFFPSRDTNQKELSPALSSLISDLAYSAGQADSIVRNVSEPYSQSEIQNIEPIVQSISNSDDGRAAVLRQRIEQSRSMLEKAPPPMKPKVEQQIAAYEAQLQEVESEQQSRAITSSLEFGEKLKPSEAAVIGRQKNLANTSINAYQNNKQDLGSLGFGIERFIELYNQNSNRSPETSVALEKIQESLLESAWFRFVSPAYRLMHYANEFMNLIGVKNSGVDREAPTEQFKEMINNLQSKYLEIVKSRASREAIEKMSDFEFLANEFAGNANLSLSSSSKRSRAMQIVAEIFKFLHLIRINIHNPESVIVFGSSQNKGQGEKVENLNMSAFTIVPTYRIKKNG